MRVIIAILLGIVNLNPTQLNANSIVLQDTTVKKRSFVISAEFRPRAEYRNGYRKVKADTTIANVFIDQRSRFSITYNSPDFIWHTSIQDIRVWGGVDPTSTTGTLQVFETYVEPSLVKNLSARIGRQRIIFDNQRLFAENNWRQSSASHDAIRFLYKTKNLQWDVVGAYNQKNDAAHHYFQDAYYPGFNTYKGLAVNHVKWIVPKGALTSLSVMDVFQDPVYAKRNHARFTYGGRLEYHHKDSTGLYLTLSGFHQSGFALSGTVLNAYYFQPEIQFKSKNKIWNIRLGGELFSGDNLQKRENQINSFDPLYGVNNRFLGNMDFFTRFPVDFKNAGLIAPYLFFQYKFSENWQVKSDYHIFFLKEKYYELSQTTPISNFLGVENDWRLTFRPNVFTSIDLGYSFAFVSNSLGIIQGINNPTPFQDWAYLMISFKPELLNYKF